MNLRVEYHCLFASSSSRYFAISWTFLSFWIGESVCPSRDVKLVLELFDVVHHRLVHVILLVPVWSCEFVTFFLDSNGVIVRIVSFGLALSDSYSLMMTLLLMVVMSSGSPPWPSSHVADLHLLQQLS